LTYADTRLSSDPRKKRTADEAWLQTVREVKWHGLPVGPQRSTGAKGRLSFEVIGHQLCFDMRYPVVTCKPNTSWVYMAAEPIWVMSGSNKLNFSPEIARIQTPYSDNGVSLHGAYGPWYRMQKGHVIDRLDGDRNTRQAVMHFWRKNPPYMKDIACTVSAQWLIRDDEIHSIFTMRSSDVGMGLPYDMLTFACMTADIASSLKEPVELGECLVNAGSRHVYEDQWDTLDVDEMMPRQYSYEPWLVWKWPAIEIVLRKIAKIDVTQFNRHDVQAEAFRGIMEASGGKTDARQDNDGNSAEPGPKGDVR